jgi:hypothetical protein
MNQVARSDSVALLDRDMAEKISRAIGASA